MSSYSRRFFILSSMALAGCGFEPAYGTGGSAEKLRNAIALDDANTRDQFTLTKALERRLGRANNARYNLSVDLNLSQKGLAITADQETTRFNVIGRADFELTDASTAQILLSGTVDSFTGYSATGTTIATQAAQSDAYERLTVILADLIVKRLVAAANDLP